MQFFKVLEKLFAMLVVAPPVYMAFRYLRWYFRQSKESAALETEQ
jgi:hypothetical protein